MKKLAVALCLTATALTAMAQGTLNFTTFVGSINAQVTYEGTPVPGPDYVGQLFVRDPGNAGSLTAVGDPVAFLSGAGAGYIFGPSVTVPFLGTGAAADVVMRAWATASGADWDTASSNPIGIIGESNEITVNLGGPGDPPQTPADLAGLQGFALTQVPEPSTVALGLIGLAALALRRRK